MRFNLRSRTAVFVVIECGVCWVPSMWRLDANFKALRKETPLLKMLPSEYCRRNIRFSTQPLEQPANVKHLWETLEQGWSEHAAVRLRLSALGFRRADQPPYSAGMAGEGART